MKIRLDYVSNSSSASFLICLPKEINDYKKEEFVNLFKTKDKTYGEDKGYFYSDIGTNGYYFGDFLFPGERTYWGTPFKLDDGKFMYNVSVHDNDNQELFSAMIEEAEQNKELIPYWKYD